MACMDPRGTVGSIYKGEYYTLVHTKYESFGPYGFGEDFFFYVFFFVCVCFLCFFFFFFFFFSNCKSKGPPGVGPFSDPRGMLGRIYVKLYITMLHAKYI